MSPTTRRLYWLLGALLLAAHFARCSWGLPLAIVVSGVQVAHVALAGCWRTLDVQVRLAYFALLGLGTLPGLGPLHLVQLVGVNALLVFDVCPLARLLTLLPWNRRQPLSWGFVRRVFLLPPVAVPIGPRLRDAAPA